jgi:hypothetical protein
VARRNALHTSLLFRWRRDLAKRTRTASASREQNFLPVPLPPPSVPQAVARSGVIEVVLAGGRTLRVGADADVALLVRIVEALEVGRRSHSQPARGCGWRPATPTCARALRRSPCWCRRSWRRIRTRATCSCSGAGAGIARQNASFGQRPGSRGIFLCLQISVVLGATVLHRSYAYRHGVGFEWGAFHGADGIS